MSLLSPPSQETARHSRSYLGQKPSSYIWPLIFLTPQAIFWPLKASSTPQNKEYEERETFKLDTIQQRISESHAYSRLRVSEISGKLEATPHFSLLFKKIQCFSFIKKSDVILTIALNWL